MNDHPRDMSTLLSLAPMDRGLPKWPQMRVRGEPMEVQQAKEIIRRTDQFFSAPDLHGNDGNYRDRVMKLLRVPTINYGQQASSRGDEYAAQDAWRERWGFVETGYVHNDWIACCFVGGPHGWCHPDGTVSFDDNVGKWPNTEEIMNDWQVLAREFPFIDLTAVLMDRESCEEEIRPICGFRVSRGGVSSFDPLREGPAETFDPKPDTDFEKSPCFGSEHEHGIPWSWVEEWSRR